MIYKLKYAIGYIHGYIVGFISGIKKSFDDLKKENM